ncbi:hypothetical protein [Niabella drilacis]|uniref:Lipoprotein n=1 Tax=Niabella drilacis (strain DSM 25811 / CCM 8410 / CCUG 62505 / LMG 26954 / E90) TaxID=1285928 RepID=A0A1G6RZI7_NIADE|nr:hypothetical protein [Niabella drilacis]SDD10080.1 hypothetical protein SAMN04487894_10625 [Niabella drilacis]
MRKKIIAALWVLTGCFLLQSCKKDKAEDKPATPPPATSKWQVNSSGYTATSTIWVSKDVSMGVPGLMAKDAASKAQIVVGFKTKPTTSGQYPVFVGNYANDLQSTQAGIEIFDGVGTWYHANKGTVSVTVTNGKLKIDLSNVSDYQNTKLTGSLVEQ